MSKKRLLAFAACLALAAGGVGYLVYHYASLAMQQQRYEALQAAVSVSSAPAPASVPASSAAPAEIPIDFAAAQQQNPDIYAWLQIPGTAVDYPILRRADDDNYYLDHNLDGSAGYPGCLYTQSCDAADFSDFNTVVYGHNMKNGTMFGGLKQYRDGDYLAAHRQIIVYTPTEKRVYTIFAAVVYSDAYLPARYDDTSAGDRQAFLDSLRDTHSLNSRVLDDPAVTADSRILTLSTCIGGQPNNRYLIEAVYTGET
jgi:sortase B